MFEGLGFRLSVQPCCFVPNVAQPCKFASANKITAEYQHPHLGHDTFGS
jgi:hypothetical protein